MFKKILILLFVFWLFKNLSDTPKKKKKVISKKKEKVISKENVSKEDVSKKNLKKDKVIFKGIIPKKVANYDRFFNEEKLNIKKKELIRENKFNSGNKIDYENYGNNVINSNNKYNVFIDFDENEENNKKNKYEEKKLDDKKLHDDDEKHNDEAVYEKRLGDDSIVYSTLMDVNVYDRILEKPVNQQLEKLRYNENLDPMTLKEVYDSVIVDYKKLKPRNINELQGCFNNKVNNSYKYTELKSDDEVDIKANDCISNNYSSI